MIECKTRLLELQEVVENLLEFCKPYAALRGAGKPGVSFWEGIPQNSPRICGFKTALHKATTINNSIFSLSLRITYPVDTQNVQDVWWYSLHVAITLFLPCLLSIFTKSLRCLVQIPPRFLRISGFWLGARNEYYSCCACRQQGQRAA